jgi:hypothetical protein
MLAREPRAPIMKFIRVSPWTRAQLHLLFAAGLALGAAPLAANDAPSPLLLQERGAQLDEADIAAIAFDGALLDGLPSATPAAILDEPENNARGNAA